MNPQPPRPQRGALPLSYTQHILDPSPPAQRRRGFLWRSGEDSNLQPGFPGACVPGKPTTVIAPLHIKFLPQLFSHSFISGSRTESRFPGNALRTFFGDRGGSRTHKAILMARRFSGPDDCQLSHPAIWRRGGDSNSQAPFRGPDGLAIRCLTNWAHLSIFDYK